ncbi:retrovirus-related pol polyprotein from transposon TNT 1-94 [Tanacetum coccineum]|uniref:Retrovirus-related pol polyprotein from transposon TNT 1-94 n=1 Tax=Tanacetum coccineum TaxID=301880 RepID=A0ABQ5DEB8_9ASTR
MTTLADKSLLSGGDNKPPMLEISLPTTNNQTMGPSSNLYNKLPSRWKMVSFTEEEIAFLAGSRTLLHSTSQTWSLRTLCFQAVDLDAETLFVMTYLDLKYLSQANLFRNGKMHYEYLSETQQETVQNSNSSAQQDVLILSMFEQLNTQVMNCTNVNLEYKSANKALTTKLDRYKEEEQGLVIAALKNELRKLKGKALDKEDIETHSVDLKKCIPKSFRDFAFHTYVGLALAINNLDPHISCGQHEELKDKKVRLSKSSSGVFQLDVRLAFFVNGNLREEVYVSQPDGFVDPDKTYYVFKLKIALYGLKHAHARGHDMFGFPWWEKIQIGIRIKKGERRSVTLFLARPTKKHLNAVKRIFRYLKGTIHRGLWYLKDSSIALTAFVDADHAGCQDTHCSTSGSLQLLGDRLVS